MKKFFEHSKSVFEAIFFVSHIVTALLCVAAGFSYMSDEWYILPACLGVAGLFVYLGFCRINGNWDLFCGWAEGMSIALLLVALVLVEMRIGTAGAIGLLVGLVVLCLLLKLLVSHIIDISDKKKHTPKLDAVLYANKQLDENSIVLCNHCMKGVPNTSDGICTNCGKKR